MPSTNSHTFGARALSEKDQPLHRFKSAQAASAWQVPNGARRYFIAQGRRVRFQSATGSELRLQPQARRYQHRNFRAEVSSALKNLWAGVSCFTGALMRRVYRVTGGTFARPDRTAWGCVGSVIKRRTISRGRHGITLRASGGSNNERKRTSKSQS